MLNCLFLSCFSMRETLSWEQYVYTLPVALGGRCRSWSSRPLCTCSQSDPESLPSRRSDISGRGPLRQKEELYRLGTLETKRVSQFPRRRAKQGKNDNPKHIHNDNTTRHKLTEKGRNRGKWKMIRGNRTKGMFVARFNLGGNGNLLCIDKKHSFSAATHLQLF